MNRGDRRELIFMDDADRQRFVETLGEVCAKTGWQVHAYVLMPNHFHWVVETPQPNLVAGMKMVAGHLDESLQPASQVLRPLVLWALQVADRGRIGQWLSQERGRLRPLESGAGETGGGGCALEEFCLEQLAGVLARALETSDVCSTTIIPPRLR